MLRVWLPTESTWFFITTYKRSGLSLDRIRTSAPDAICPSHTSANPNYVGKGSEVRIRKGSHNAEATTGYPSKNASMIWRAAPKLFKTKSAHSGTTITKSLRNMKWHVSSYILMSYIPFSHFTQCCSLGQYKSIFEILRFSLSCGKIIKLFLFPS